MAETKHPVTGKQSSIPYIVTKIPDLNLLERNAIQTLGISVDNALGLRSIESQAKRKGVEAGHPATSDEPYVSLQRDCQKLCDEFLDLFKPELGCLKDFELEVKFKADAVPVFHKARPVPFALRDDLVKGYGEGIAKGVWKPVQFNEYGTPLVLIRKAHTSGSLKTKLWICGDYSVGINDQLEDHRHPLPLPEKLMQKLGGGFGYTKINLADAYNQIQLAPESQRRLALSTHRGVLLQQRLPFGIKSAPGHFQEIMENLTSDLPGVAVFQDNMLVSGQDANDHLSNLKRLLTRLNDKGLRCRRDKCQFAQPSVEYLGHTLSAEGISKGSKVKAVLKIRTSQAWSLSWAQHSSTGSSSLTWPAWQSLSTAWQRRQHPGRGNMRSRQHLNSWRMYCPRIKFWYTSIQTKLWYWLVTHPTLELEQSWFIAIRMKASIQLPTCPRFSLLQKETTVKYTRKRCPSYTAWRSSTSTFTDARSYWWQIISHWQHCSVQRKGRHFSQLTD